MCVVVCVAGCVLYVCPGAHQGQGLASLPVGQDTAPSSKVLQVFWGKVKAMVGEGVELEADIPRGRPTSPQ